MMPFFLILKGFLTNALGFVLKYWKQIIVIGMFVLIFNQNFMNIEPFKWFGFRTIPAITEEYEGKLQVMTEQLVECEASREALKEAITSTNDQIDQWAALTGKLQNDHNNLATELATLKKKSNQAVQDVLAGPTPKNCAAAIQFLKDSAQGDLRWRPRR